MAVPVPEPRCPLCRGALLRLADAILTCHRGCVITDRRIDETWLWQVESWFYEQRRRNLRTLVAEKKRRGLALTVSIQEERMSWNGPVPVGGTRRVRGLDFEDEDA